MPTGPKHYLPAEHFGSAIRTGFRYARNNLYLRATLIRGAAFFLFASASGLSCRLSRAAKSSADLIFMAFCWAGLGQALWAVRSVLPWLRKKLGPDRLVAAGTIGTTITLVLFAVAHNAVTALSASVIAGMSWIAVLSLLNVSAQVALPEWVRGRGLAMFVTAFYGAMTVGSAIWGQIAALVGLPTTHFVAAVGILLAIPFTWRWKLEAGAAVDLAPSLHWPAPITIRDVEHDRGPVLVTVEYRIALQNRKAFLLALEKMERERRRDGAYAWGVFEDTAEEGRFLETFLVESWLEHLRQHERVTNADRSRPGGR